MPTDDESRDGEISVEVLTGRAALDALPGLTGLCDAVAAPFTARAPYWIAAARLRSAWEPLLVTVRRSGQLVAAAPLARHRRGGVTRVELLSGDRADHGRLPARDHAAARALAAAVADLLHRQRRWRLHLCQLPPGDPVVSALAEHVGVELAAGVPCPLTHLDFDRPVYDQLKRNSKKATRSARNGLATDGRAFTTTWDTGADAVALLPELFEVRRERDHAVGRSSDIDDPAATAFHVEVLTGLAALGRLEVLRCYIDGELASYDITLPEPPHLRVYDGRIRPGFDAYSPGWLAALEILERAHRDRLLVDWMRGETQLKQRSATELVAAVDVTAYSSRAVRAAARGGRALAERGMSAARSVVPPERRRAIRRLVARGGSGD